MVEYTWDRKIDKLTSKNIEDSIRLQIIDVYFNDVRPLKVVINVLQDGLEGVIYDKNETVLNTFNLSSNGNITTIINSVP